jgi:hypothetical protein
MDNFSCELDKIARKYNCDKGYKQYLSNKWKNVKGLNWSDSEEKIEDGHNYVELYDKYFYDLKDKKINILEIGMGNYPTNGYSLRMWLEYFTKAKIFIIDNNNNNFKCDFEYDKSRVFFHVCDQSNEKDLKKFINTINNKFDIIIDDGSHNPKHQILTYKLFFPLILKNEGIYIVEDLFESKNFDNIDENFMLFINKESLKIQSNIILNKVNLENNDNIKSIHIYGSLIIIFKSFNKITK